LRNETQHKAYRELISIFSCHFQYRIQVHADRGGYVYINGKQAELKKFNNNAYDAKLKGGNVTISITINPDESVSISYTGPGRANGVCQVAD
jgi:hypothetical protein